MAAFLGALGRMCARGRFTVFALWFVLAVGAGAAGAAYGGMFLRDASFPGMPSQQAIEIAHHDFPQYTGPTATLVFHPLPDRSLDDWRIELNVGRSLEAMQNLPRVAYVDNPYAPISARLHSGRAALAVVYFEGTMRDLTIADLEALQAAAEPAVKSGVEMEVGGPIAIVAAQPESSWQEAAGIVLAVVVLLLAFRSLTAAVIPVALSIGASYGVLVAVFQWGWGVRLVGLDEPVPIVSFVPLFMFALVFGLSMDYEVFLLSRIREAYERTGDPAHSVVLGLGATARLISSAALIMICVFLSFLGQPDAMVKMAALGLAVAVAVDATVVRLILVPAFMALLGHTNWWFPRRRWRP